MTKQRPGKAVRLLETAFEKDASCVAVRVELANALFATKEVDMVLLCTALEFVGWDERVANDPDTTEWTRTNGPVADSATPRSLNGSQFVLLTDRDTLFRHVTSLLLEGVFERRGDALARAPIADAVDRTFCALDAGIGEAVRRLRQRNTVTDSRQSLLLTEQLEAERPALREERACSEGSEDHTELDILADD